MLVTPQSAPKQPDSGFFQSIAITERGVVLGDGSTLVRMTRPKSGMARLSLETDTGRLIAMLSAAFGRLPAAADTLHHIQAAVKYWDCGDKALANFRLIFADLPRVRDQRDVDCLRLAEYVLDKGISPHVLMDELGLSAGSIEFHKYREDEPRVPAGFGDESGRWTSDPSFQTTGPRSNSSVQVAEDLPEEDEKTYETRRLTGQTSRQEDIEHGREEPLKLPAGVGIGPYAREGVPAGPGRRPTETKQLQVDAEGKQYGCHTCGTKDPGSSSGKFYCDHQKQTALYITGEPQLYFRHCRSCSSMQGWLVRKYLRGR